jgi:hypothetical protein
MILIAKLDFSRGSLNIIKSYINRYFRLTPVLMILTLFFMTSMAPEGGLLVDMKFSCSTEWTRTLLLNLDLNSSKIVIFF